MTTVFLDTVGLIAPWDIRDQWNRAAEMSMVGLVENGAVLVTTELVLAECANAAARRPYRGAVVALRRLLSGEDRIITPELADVDDAWRAYAAGHAADAGVVDHVSFAVMRRMGIEDAFTNDRHFKAAGFRTLF